VVTTDVAELVSYSIIYRCTAMTTCDLNLDTSLPSMLCGRWRFSV
jgi:hypothetical protein